VPLQELAVIGLKLSEDVKVDITKYAAREEAK
jgi:hypothetical protein